MKKVFLFLALTTVVSIFSLVAQSDTATILLRGTVPKIVSVTITSTGANETLDLLAVVSNLEIATVRERSNVRAGYEVTLSSANAGSLLGAAGESIIYDLAYGGVPVIMTAGSATLTTGGVKTPADGVAKSLTISYDGVTANLSDDTYEDLLTFTITAN